MTKFNTLAMSTAIAALLGGSAVAQSVSVGAGADATAGVGAGAAGVSGTVATELNANAGTTSATAATAGAMADATADAATGGTVILSSDGARIGTVAETRTAADGELRYVIDLDGQLGVDVPRVQIAAVHTSEADGAVVLAMSQADFVAAVEAQAGAQAGAAAQTN